MIAALPQRFRRPACALVLLMAVGCGGDGGGEDPGAVRASARPCDGLTVVKNGTPPPPADLPTVAGWTQVDTVSQGSTTIWLGTVEGEDVVVLRDKAVAALTAGGGYEIPRSDQEGQAEAEAEFTGRHEGSIQVIPLCEGTLRVRYRVSAA